MNYYPVLAQSFEVKHINNSYSISPIKLHHLAEILPVRSWDGLPLLLRLIDFQSLNLKWEFVFLITKLKEEARDSLGDVHIPHIALLLKYRK